MIYFSWSSFFIGIGVVIGIYYLGIFVFFTIQSKKQKTNTTKVKENNEEEGDSMIPEYQTSQPKDVYNFLSENIVTPEPETKECEEETPNMCLPVENFDTSESFPEIPEQKIYEEPELEYKDYQDDLSNDIPFGDIENSSQKEDISEIKDSRNELNDQFKEFVLDKNDEVEDVHIGGESIDEFIANMRKEDSPFALIPSFEEAIAASGGYTAFNKI